MAQAKPELNKDELAAHWQEYVPADGNVYELAFDYPSSDSGRPKERLGRIEKITPDYVTLELYTDGDEHHEPGDKVFKSFNFNRIEGEIEVYEIS